MHTHLQIIMSRPFHKLNWGQDHDGWTTPITSVQEEEEAETKMSFQQKAQKWQQTKKNQNVWKELLHKNTLGATVDRNPFLFFTQK